MAQIETQATLWHLQPLREKKPDVFFGLLLIDSPTLLITLTVRIFVF
jgi:hypothetical protein